VSDNVIPDDPHVQETFPAPQELFSLPTIRYNEEMERRSLIGKPVPVTAGRAEVLCARVLEHGILWEQHGPVVAMM
jgi:hypothetical protein